MSTSPNQLRRAWSVGRYRVTLEVARPAPGQVMGVAIEWDPVLPARLTADELKQYRTGRDSALADISKALGINAVVLET